MPPAENLDPGDRRLWRLGLGVSLALLAVLLVCVVIAVWVEPAVWALVAVVVVLGALWLVANRR